MTVLTLLSLGASASSSEDRAASGRSLGTKPCETTIVGLGPGHANAVDGAFLGRSLAQVFVAPDTLIRSITVWRQPDQFELTVPMHLFIGAMDPADSLRPSPGNPLHDGPSIVLQGTSDVARPVRYEFDPPLSLPARGRYFFAVKEDWCTVAFGLLAESPGSYADGDAWMILPYPRCEELGGHGNHLDGLDLIFEIEFCDQVVGTRNRTWGAVKAGYR